MNVEFVKAKLEHCQPIADNMRECDKNEVWAASNQSPFEALTSSFHMSDYCQTAMLDGVPCAMYGLGVSPAFQGYGAPWLLATDDLKLWWFEFLKRSRRVIDEMLSYCPTLFNYVDARNETSIKWLRWLGFEFSDKPEPWGLEQIPFYLFQMQRKQVI